LIGKQFRGENLKEVKDMHCKCFNLILAAIIIVFSFWQISASMIIIISAAALILVMEVLSLVKEGCSCHGASCCMGHKTGEEIFVDKNPKSDLPSKTEVKEVIEKKKAVNNKPKMKK